MEINCDLYTLKKPRIYFKYEALSKIYCARDWIRTSTSLRTLRPEHSASTNFATRASLFRAANITDYTETLKSLNASFKLVLRSVDAFRFPMINAQLT